MLHGWYEHVRGLTPTKLGTYLEKCAELCGAYHSQRLFNVQVVTLPEYYAHLNDLKAEGPTGEIPVNPEATTVPCRVRRRPRSERSR